MNMHRLVDGIQKHNRSPRKHWRTTSKQRCFEGSPLLLWALLVGVGLACAVADWPIWVSCLLVDAGWLGAWVLFRQPSLVDDRSRTSRFGSRPAHGL